MNKGILIPRLTETQRNDINVSKNINGDFDVNINGNNHGLMIFNTTENCFNHWHSIDKEWKSLCGNFGKALFTFECAKITAGGNYITSEELNGSHFITIKDVNITKPGSYTIVAKSTPSNGYSFIGEGTFTSTGLQTIRLYAQGVPNSSKTDTFNINSSGDNNQTNCTVDISVQPSNGTYTINCSNILVNGSYAKGSSLNSSNTISIYVNVETLGSYNISSNLINGITFQKSGIFTTRGVQIVTLVGSGTPTVNADFPITITTNTSSGNNSCSVNIPILFPSLTYATIASSISQGYTWGADGQARINAMKDLSNFGPDGIVKMKDGFKAFTPWNTTGYMNTNNATNWLMTNVDNPLIKKPDIIFFYAVDALSVDLATALAKYVNNGGVLIYGTEDGDATGTNNLLNGIFNQGNAVRQIAGTLTNDNIYPISNLPNDPIVNGPFGNSSNRFWGEDNSSVGSVILTKLPPNSIQIASAFNDIGKADVNPDYSIVWYNDSKNLVYFGDSVGTGESTSNSAYPSHFQEIYLLQNYTVQVLIIDLFITLF